jgi:large subunit ribosomal protein L28
MSRRCYFTGKKTRAGGSITRRGKAKYLGGVGRKITGRSKRKFKPNIQKVRAVVDGKICRIRVSAKAIKLGLITKPPKRTWRPEPEVPVPTEPAAVVATADEAGPATEGVEDSSE